MKIYFNWLGQWIKLENGDFVDGNPFEVFKEYIKELLMDQNQLDLTVVNKNGTNYFIRNKDIVWEVVDN